MNSRNFRWALLNASGEFEHLCKGINIVGISLLCCFKINCREVEEWIVFSLVGEATSVTISVPCGQKKIWVTIHETVATGANHSYDKGYKYQTAKDIGTTSIVNWPIFKLVCFQRIFVGL